MNKQRIMIVGASAEAASKLITDAGFEVSVEDLEREGLRIEEELAELARREVRELSGSPRAGYERRNKSDRKRNKAERWR